MRDHRIAFAAWRWWVQACEITQKELRALGDRLVEDDGAQPGDDPNKNAEEHPLTEVVAEYPVAYPAPATEVSAGTRRQSTEKVAIVSPWRDRSYLSTAGRCAVLTHRLGRHPC